MKSQGIWIWILSGNPDLGSDPDPFTATCTASLRYTGLPAFSLHPALAGSPALMSILTGELENHLAFFR